MGVPSSTYDKTEMNSQKNKPGRRNNKKSRTSFITPKTAPYVFVLPAVLFFLLFTAYPIVKSFILSFQKSEAGVNSFAGLDNYIRLFQDSLFYQSLANTLIILVVQVPIMIFFAIVLANLMNSYLIKMKGLFRVSFFSPAVTSLVSASVIFLLLLNPDYGIINYLLSFLGIDPIGWLNSPFWAKISIVLGMIWRWSGYNIIIILAGLLKHMDTE